ncbi:MAG: phage head closure protein [Methyloceanibacter sp.]
MTAFSPSDLRQRLVLEQLTREEDDGGGFTEEWAEMATFAASLRPLSGEERFESDRLTGSVTHEIVLRYRPGVVAAMRFRQDARVFHILSVINVAERRSWLKCLCEEREL